jgi:trk system potassium uptake protein TrkA
LAKGHDLTVICPDQAGCEELSRRLRIAVVKGDGSDPALLEEAGIHGIDVALAVTERDQDNLAVCLLAAEKGVPRVIAMVNDPENEEVFRKLGVDAFSPVRIVSGLIEQRTALDAITNLVPAGEGKVNIAEIRLPENAPSIGKPLASLALPENALLATVLRGEKAIVPRGATELRPGDKLILVTLPESHGAALMALLGMER